MTDFLVKPIENKYIELSTPRDINLVVLIPMAEPTITCVIATEEALQTCNGSTSINTICDIDISLKEVGHMVIVVNLTFIALPRSTTEIIVVVKGAYIMPHV